MRLIYDLERHSVTYKVMWSPLEFSFLLFFVVALCGIWDLSSPIRDQTHTQWKCGVLTTDCQGSPSHRNFRSTVILAWRLCWNRRDWSQGDWRDYCNNTGETLRGSQTRFWRVACMGVALLHSGPIWRLHH